LQAIILAGGKGTRLRPYTTNFPKPLMPIDDLPILEIVVRQLARAGFDRLIVTTGHLAELIRVFCGDGAKWGVRIEYSHEEEPLGTAGPLSLVEERLDDNFLVMNGDLLTTMDYRKAFESHVASGAMASISLYQRDVKIDFGVVEEEPAGQLGRYIEKPTLSYSVSMGINFFNRGALRYMERGKRLDIPELMMRLKQAGERVACARQDCYWLDIGRTDDYAVATDEFQKRREQFLPRHG
jgi:NDP-sugar pyrophosphorylase family protein